MPEESTDPIDDALGQHVLELASRCFGLGKRDSHDFREEDLGQTVPPNDTSSSLLARRKEIDGIRHAQSPGGDELGDCRIELGRVIGQTEVGDGTGNPILFPHAPEPLENLVGYRMNHHA
jgi:hypothetical protein